MNYNFNETPMFKENVCALCGFRTIDSNEAVIHVKEKHPVILALAKAGYIDFTKGVKNE